MNVDIYLAKIKIKGGQKAVPNDLIFTHLIDRYSNTHYSNSLHLRSRV
jgi:hypothetical protein